MISTTDLPGDAHAVVFEGQAYTLQPIQGDTGGAHRQAKLLQGLQDNTMQAHSGMQRSAHSAAQHNDSQGTDCQTASSPRPRTRMGVRTDPTALSPCNHQE